MGSKKKPVLGHMPKYARRPMRTRKVKEKSTRPESAALRGITSLGKYTLVIRWAFPTKLFEHRFRVLAK